MTYFLVLSYRTSVLWSISFAESVVGAILGLNLSPSLCSRMFCGPLP